jgi:hypothetical protein
MDTSPELLEKAFTAKETRRRALARASFEEKFGILIRLQEMAAAIAKTRGQVLRPWSRASNLVKAAASPTE